MSGWFAGNKVPLWKIILVPQRRKKKKKTNTEISGKTFGDKTKIYLDLDYT